MIPNIAGNTRQAISCDFKRASMNATDELLPNVEIKGCFTISLITF